MAGSGDDSPTVGVVGDDSLAGAVRSAGADPVVGDADTVREADPELLLAAGDDALAGAVRSGVDCSVLAVGAVTGVPSVSREGLDGALAAALAGDLETVTRRPFAAATDGAEATAALREVLLVSDEPARIAEYSIHSGDRRVARFRADGVVVATPVGSRGYARDAGGPVLDPGTGVAAAVPLAPFQTDREHWVLDATGISLRVEREVPVVLVADGREVSTVAAGTAVDLSLGAPVRLLAGGDWKNSNGERTE